jgi:DnaJ-class molecular chaperone
MTTLTCPDCDLPGDGDCSACHGRGKTLGERLLGTVAELVDESTCSACGGSGHCPTCGGIGEIEVGGESG